MSTHDYSHKDIVRLADLLKGPGSEPRVGLHSETINKLFTIIEELAYMPHMYSNTLVGYATNDFIANVDKCFVKAKTPMTTDDVKKEQIFPIQIMYLHENRNMISKNIQSQSEMDELEESTFVKAYWKVNSLGDAIRCLLQASDLDANPVELSKLYKEWKLEDVLSYVDDKEFAKHVMIKATEWENKAEEVKNEENKLLKLMDTFFGGKLDA